MGQAVGGSPRDLDSLCPQLSDSPPTRVGGSRIETAIVAASIQALAISPHLSSAGTVLHVTDPQLRAARQVVLQHPRCASCDLVAVDDSLCLEKFLHVLDEGLGDLGRTVQFFTQHGAEYSGRPGYCGSRRWTADAYSLCLKTAIFLSRCHSSTSWPSTSCLALSLASSSVAQSKSYLSRT